MTNFIFGQLRIIMSILFVYFFAKRLFLHTLTFLSLNDLNLHTLICIKFWTLKILVLNISALAMDVINALEFFTLSFLQELILGMLLTTDDRSKLLKCSNENKIKLLALFFKVTSSSSFLFLFWECSVPKLWKLEKKGLTWKMNSRILVGTTENIKNLVTVVESRYNT